MPDTRSTIARTLTKAIFVVLLGVCATALPEYADAQQTPALRAKPASKASAAAASVDEEEAPKPQKGGGEGIHVNGHWVMDLTDKDGKLVEHRDFHNALNDSSALVGLLTGWYSSGGMGIQLSGSGSQFLLYPAAQGAASIYCQILSQSPTVTCVPGMTQVPVVGNPNETYGDYRGLTLQGAIEPAQAITLTSVGTFIYYCGVTAPKSLIAGPVTPATCGTTTTLPFFSYPAPQPDGTQYVGSDLFTAKDISSAPIAVAPGQHLKVTVTITFN